MSYWDHPKTVRRSRSVDIDAIARVSAELCDDGGLHALTMRSVASSLGVAPASLYSRVDSVDDLFDLALDRVLGDDAAMAEAISHGDLRALLLAFFLHLQRHRWACRIIGMRAPRGPKYLQLSEALVTLLDDGGVADPLSASYALSNVIIGSAMTAPMADDERATRIDVDAAPRYARFHATHEIAPEAIVGSAIDALLAACSFLQE